MEDNVIQVLIEDYLEQLDKAVSESRPTDGLFGLGKALKNHPCHESFYEAVGKAVKSIDNEEDALSAAKSIISADRTYDCPVSAKLMLTAVQSHIKVLISYLNDDDRKELIEYMDRYIPKRNRLPIQTELYKTLKNKK